MARTLVYAGYNFFSSALETLLRRTDVRVVLCLTGAIDEHVTNVVRLCKEATIPIHHGKLTTKVIDSVVEMSPDIVFCAAYSFRIPVTRLGVKYNLNLHPSILPHGRGPNPLPYLVESHTQYSGLSLHEMTDQFDNGAVLAQTRIPIEGKWGFDELAMAMYLQAPHLVNKVFDRLDHYFALRKAQSEGSYWPIHSNEDRTIDWSDSVLNIARKSRMFGAIGIRCPIEGAEFEVTVPISFVRFRHDFAPGEVLMKGKGFWYVAASDGVVRLTIPG